MIATNIFDDYAIIAAFGIISFMLMITRMPVLFLFWLLGIIFFSTLVAGFCFASIGYEYLEYRKKEAE